MKLPAVRLPVRDHAGADQQHGRLRDRREERQQRRVGRALAVRRDRLVEDALRAVAELLLLGRLLRERLDHVDADDVLLRHGGDVGQPLLHLAQRRVRDVAVAVCDHDQQRRDRERDQRELPREEEEDDRDRDDRQHVLEEEDQPVAEEEAHALEVDGCAAHQLAGLVAVVEAERQPDEACVHGAPHVHLDVERLPAGDDPAAEHEQRSGDPENDDRRDGLPELVRVVVDERLVDHVAPGDPDQRDRAGLGAHGEDDRDDQPGAVGAEESEQPEEGRAVLRLLCHRSNLAAGPYAAAGRRRAPRAYASRSSSVRTSASARSSRARFAAACGQLLAPDGWGSGTTTAPSRSNRSPTHSVSSVLPSIRRSARPPTVTIRAGRSSASSRSRQCSQSSCSRGVGVRSPRPEAARPGIAAGHGRAIERGVERLLVQLEPAAQHLAGAAPPGQTLLALDDARRLAEEIRALARERRAHRQRFEPEPGVGAGTAAGRVALERGDGAVSFLKQWTLCSLFPIR